MDTSQLPAPMPSLPRPGQQVRWRDPRHAFALGWAYALGQGPFVVIATVDRSGQGLPTGILLGTSLGPREINEVWLTADSPSCNGYAPELLTLIEG
jgi:hypothetical protein